MPRFCLPIRVYVFTQMVALLRELITARTIHSKYMDSKVAHSTAQRFNTEVRHLYGMKSTYLSVIVLGEQC